MITVVLPSNNLKVRQNENSCNDMHCGTGEKKKRKKEKGKGKREKEKAKSEKQEKQKKKQKKNTTGQLGATGN
jgi:hypothetical protein